MSRALAYCAFLEAPEISLPQTGVGGAAVHALSTHGLCLLWSEVEWPFRPEKLQKHAVEFHGVIQHMFRQKAVVPFRLLSVFDDERALTGFMAEHQAVFITDLERLSSVVQMECVVYPMPGQAAAGSGSGTAYLRGKAEALWTIEGHASRVQEALAGLAREIRVREGKNGTRIFVLVERGAESEFRAAVERVVLPERLSQRVSGPWPAAEFLSEKLVRS